MNEMEKLLAAYEVDVDFPDVSGMEHLQMLMTRSQLHKFEAQLSGAQKRRLLAADQKLLKQAHLFSQTIQLIANLAEWRRLEDVTPDHWWWYLDVLAQLPEGTVISSTKAVTP
jgi:hypothetical protein